MLDYNTQLKKLELPEYGRNIQRMVDYCTQIEDREERTRCAYAIIATMGNLFPHLRDINDFKHKLWDHLAIMSDFKLDIDYPYEVLKPDNLYTRPNPIKYKLTSIKYRHYGKLMEEMLGKYSSFPEGSDERKQFISLLRGSHIVIISDKTHPEVVGINGWCNDSAIVIETEKEAENLTIEDLKLRSIKELQVKKANNNRNNRHKK